MTKPVRVITATLINYDKSFLFVTFHVPTYVVSGTARKKFRSLVSTVMNLVYKQFLDDQCTQQ